MEKRNKSSDEVSRMMNSLCDAISYGEMNFSMLVELIEKQKETYPLLLKMETQVLSDLNKKMRGSKGKGKDIYGSYDDLASAMNIRRGLAELSEKIQYVENGILATSDLLGHSVYFLRYTKDGKPVVEEVKGEGIKLLEKALGIK